MIKPSNPQCIFLSTVSQRDDGGVYPLPSTLTPGGGITRAVGSRCPWFVDERETSCAHTVRRADRDIRYRMFLKAPAPPRSALAKRPEKLLLRRSNCLPCGKSVFEDNDGYRPAIRRDGATWSELIEATDWPPHTTPAALTGIRKKGHVFERTKRDGVIC